MKLAWTLAIVVISAGAALAAGPGAPIQAPQQAPQQTFKEAPPPAPLAADKQAAFQAPQQSPVQSPVQKGGGYSARRDSGYRSFSYEPGYSDGYGYDSYNDYGNGFGRSRNRAAWSNVTNKALGRY
jgi:hypothetical protein